MPETKFVQIRIPEERKSRWQSEARENPEWRSLTHLIVTSVEMQLRGHTRGGGGDIDLSRVHDRFDTITDQLDAIEDRVDETYYHVSKDTANYTELTKRINELIPEVEDREAVLTRMPEEDDALRETVRETRSVSHLVKLLQREGYKPLNVKAAVEHLTDNSATIEATYARPQEFADKRVYRLEA